MLPYTHIAFVPGSRWSYSNLGYVFLGQIIERLTGDDFEVYIDKNILKPLGMTASYFDRAPYFLESHVSASYLRAGAKLTPQPFNFDTGITTSNSGLKAPISGHGEVRCAFSLATPAIRVMRLCSSARRLKRCGTACCPRSSRAKRQRPIPPARMARSRRWAWDFLLSKSTAIATSITTATRADFRRS